MKFNLNINQKAIIDLGLNLDLEDCAIFDFIKDYAHSPSCEKIYHEGRVYYWISYKIIMDQLPIIKVGKKSIYRKVAKLVEAKLLEPYVNNKAIGRSFYGFGENYTRVISETARTKMSEGLGHKSPRARTKMSEYNNIKDNSIKDNTTEPIKKAPRIEGAYAVIKKRFMEWYKLESSRDYYFTPGDGAAVLGLEKKMVFSFKSAHKKDPTAEQIDGAWAEILKRLPTFYKGDGASLKVMNSKYNEIIAKLSKNGPVSTEYLQDLSQRLEGLKFD